MLRSDLSVSVGELGSLNDHSGPIAEAEKNAARVFGADYTFFSVGGSSASNEIVLHSAVTDGDAVLPVTYDRILPDLFREGQAVVATGRMANGVFIAEDVLAKHDETYMPKELADKMGMAHTKHQVPATTPTTETP